MDFKPANFIGLIAGGILGYGIGLLVDSSRANNGLPSTPGIIVLCALLGYIVSRLYKGNKPPGE
jgi:hypothetical protein